MKVKVNIINMGMIPGRIVNEVLTGSCETKLVMMMMFKGKFLNKKTEQNTND